VAVLTNSTGMSEKNACLLWVEVYSTTPKTQAKKRRNNKSLRPEIGKKEKIKAQEPVQVIDTRWRGQFTHKDWSSETVHKAENCTRHVWQNHSFRQTKSFAIAIRA
jgi:hypothetical protein